MNKVKSRTERFEAMEQTILKRIHEAEKTLSFHKEQAEINRELILKLHDEHIQLCNNFKNQTI